MLMPCMHDVTSRRYAAHREMAGLVGLRGPGGRHRDDEAHHHRVDVAVDRIYALSGERGAACRSAPVQPEVEGTEIDVREDVVTERIIVRKGDASTCLNDGDVRPEFAAAHGNDPRAHGWDVVHRNGALAGHCHAR